MKLWLSKLAILLLFSLLFTNCTLYQIIISEDEMAVNHTENIYYNYLILHQIVLRVHVMVV